MILPYFCSVKYLCVLLAFLVLTLSAQPVCASISTADSCCNEYSCSDDDGSSESENEHGCSGVCNPFQSCNCCVFGALPSPLSIFKIKALITYIDFAWGAFRCPSVQAPILSFWQPPKLVQSFLFNTFQLASSIKASRFIHSFCSILFSLKSTMRHQIFIQ